MEMDLYVVRHAFAEARRADLQPFGISMPCSSAISRKSM
jgi:hypothetical protein